MVPDVDPHTGTGKPGGRGHGHGMGLYGQLCLCGGSDDTGMAQVKVAGEAVRSQQDCAEVYSDMATVSSSAGESKKTPTLCKNCHYSSLFIIISPSCHPPMMEILAVKCHFFAFCFTFVYFQ